MVSRGIEPATMRSTRGTRFNAALVSSKTLPVSLASGALVKWRSGRSSQGPWGSHLFCSLGCTRQQPELNSSKQQCPKAWVTAQLQCLLAACHRFLSRNNIIPGLVTDFFELSLKNSFSQLDTRFDCLSLSRQHFRAKRFCIQKSANREFQPRFQP